MFKKISALMLTSIGLSFADFSANPTQTVQNIGSTLGSTMSIALSGIVLGLGAASIFHTVKGYTHAHSEAKQERSGNPVFAGITGAMTNSIGWWLITAIAYFLVNTLTGGQLGTLITNFLGSK